MPETITLNLPKAIDMVEMLKEGSNAGMGNEGSAQVQEAQQQSLAEKQRLSELCQVLENITEKIASVHKHCISESKEQIVDLSIEIARKILNQKIENDDYDIKPVIQEILNSSPAGKEIKISLNPSDFKACEKIQKEEKLFGNVTFIADPDIKKTECVFESSKGNIESFVDSKLKQISEEFKRIMK